jgi:hypothetical protein
MRVRTAAKRHTSGMLSGRQIILMDDGTRGVTLGSHGSRRPHCKCRYIAPRPEADRSSILELKRFCAPAR